MSRLTTLLEKDEDICDLAMTTEGDYWDQRYGLSCNNLINNSGECSECPYFQKIENWLCLD